MISPVTSDMDVSSVFELKASIWERVGYNYQLKSKRLQAAHNEFNNSQQSLSPILTMNFILSVLSVPFITVAVANLTRSGNRLVWAVALSFIVLANIASWRVYTHYSTDTHRNGGLLSQKAKEFLRVYVASVFFVINSVICGRLINKVTMGSCEVRVDLLDDWNCNPVADSRSLPGGPTIVSMLIPLMYIIIVRGAYFGCSLILWVETIIALIFCLVYSQATNSILFVVYYIAGSWTMIVEVRKLNIFLFFTHQKLLDTLKEHEKASNAANAEEMRHMIANVAHDLKTVSASPY